MWWLGIILKGEITLVLLSLGEEVEVDVSVVDEREDKEVIFICFVRNPSYRFTGGKGLEIRLPINFGDSITLPLVDSEGAIPISFYIFSSFELALLLLEEEDDDAEVVVLLPFVEVVLLLLLMLLLQHKSHRIILLSLPEETKYNYSEYSAPSERCDFSLLPLALSLRRFMQVMKSECPLSKASCSKTKFLDLKSLFICHVLITPS